MKVYLGKKKAKLYLSKKQDDFLDRYAEALLSLEQNNSSRELIMFYGNKSVIYLIKDYWYGNLEDSIFKKRFLDLTIHFRLNSSINNFSVNEELEFFIKSLKRAINENRTAGEAEIVRALHRIEKNASGLIDSKYFFDKEYIRSSSNNRYKLFTGEKGRFGKLKINCSILARIQNKSFANQDFQEYGPPTLPVLDDLTLKEIIPKLWGHEFSHALAIGPGGIGKTVSMLDIWEQWSCNSIDLVPIPIYIPLNEFNHRREKNFIRNYIEVYYDVGTSVDHFLKQPGESFNGKNYPNTILLLDGINEITINLDILLNEIKQLIIKENFPGLQVIISSRGGISDLGLHQFHVLKLCLLTEEQVRSYTKLQLPKDHRLVEFLRNPMMLSIYTTQSELINKQRLIVRNLKNNVTSTGELLKNVEIIERGKIEEYSSTRAIRAFKLFILEHLLPFIGWKMQQRGLFSIKKLGHNDRTNGLQAILIEGISVLLNDDLFEVFDDYDDLNEEGFIVGDRKLFSNIVSKVICKELSLMIKEESYYSFLHQAYRDYFAARHVQNQIKVSLFKKKIPVILAQSPLNYYVRQLLGELEEEHTNLISWDNNQNRWCWTKGQFFINNNLFKILEKCRRVFDINEIGYTVWNLLSIWRDLRKELTGADLSFLNFHEFPFYYVRMSRLGYGTNLANSIVSKTNFYANGHTGWVTGAAFSPNGELVATCSIDQTVKIWEIKSGKCNCTFKGHQGDIRSIAYSPNGEYILTGSKDNTARLWDISSGREKYILKGHFLAVTSVAFDPDGRHVLTGSEDKTVILWETETGKKIECLQQHQGAIISACFSLDGEKIITSSFDNTVITWDAITRENLDVIKEESGAKINRLTPLRGNLIAIGLSDNTMKIWNYKTKERYEFFNEIHDAPISSICFAPNKNLLVTGSYDKRIKVWDIEKEKHLLTFEGHSHSVLDVSFNHNENRIVSASADNTAKIWDVESGGFMITLEGRLQGITSVAYSSCGKLIVTASLDRITKVWDAESGYCLMALGGHSHGIGCAIFSPDDKYIITGSYDKTAQIWDAKTGISLRKLIGHTDYVSWVNYSPDGNYILTGSFDKTVIIWNAYTGGIIGKLEGHTHFVSSAVYSPDMKNILTSSWDQSVIVWDAKTYRPINKIDKHQGQVRKAIYNQNGSKILTGSMDSTAKLWDAHSLKCLYSLEGHTMGVRDVEFSPENDYILTGSFDGKAKLWSAEKGNLLMTFTGHASGIRSVAFSPNGENILTGSLDNTAKIWTQQSKKELKTICNIDGWFFNGCNFENSVINTNLDQDDITLLKSNGGIINKTDLDVWNELMEKHYSIKANI